ncbi:MAG: GDSL-type esterase/lipase family protein [Gammaproteobacteria bacterium]
MRHSCLFALLLLVAGCGNEQVLRLLPRDGVILAFGDSLTHGTGVDPAHSYPAVLARLTGRKVINDGIPGEVTSRGVERLPASLAAHRPDLVVLIHGGNDTLRRVSAARTKQNLERMVETIRAAGADVVVLAVSGANLFLTAPDYYGEVAEELNVPIDADTVPALMRDAAMKSDRVHFNRVGYAALASAVKALLESNGAL